MGQSPAHPPYSRETWVDFFCLPRQTQMPSHRSACLGLAGPGASFSEAADEWQGTVCFPNALILNYCNLNGKTTRINYAAGNKITFPLTRERARQRVCALWAGGTARFQLTPGARLGMCSTGRVQSALPDPLRATEDGERSGTPRFFSPSRASRSVLSPSPLCGRQQAWPSLSTNSDNITLLGAAVRIGVISHM